LVFPLEAGADPGRQDARKDDEIIKDRYPLLSMQCVAALANRKFDEVDFSSEPTAIRPVDWLRQMRFRARLLIGAIA
jgi:hypothetical protein